MTHGKESLLLFGLGCFVGVLVSLGALPKVMGMLASRASLYKQVAQMPRIGCGTIDIVYALPDQE